MLQQVKKLFSILEPRTRSGLSLMFLLMVMVAFFEMLGVGLFLPFLQVLSTIGSDNELVYIAEFRERFWGGSTKNFLIFMCGTIFVFFVFKSIVLACVIYIQNRYVFRHHAYFSQFLMRHYLTKPYEFHLNRNSMELTRNVHLLSSRIFAKGLMPILQFSLEVLVITGIFIVLLFIDPISTLMVSFILGTSVVSYYLIIRKHIRRWGARTIELESELLVCINQALNSIKETKLYQIEGFIDSIFSSVSNERAMNMAKSSTAPHLPRYFIEAIAIGAMVLLVGYLITKSSASIENIIPTLGIFAVAAMRLMPSLSKLVGAVTTFRENSASIDALYQDIYFDAPHQPDLEGPHSREKLLSHDSLIFCKSILVDSLGFKYPNAPDHVLKDINLEIIAGSSTAFVGTSGAGKTTLIDIILGLLVPTEGQVRIDGQSIHEDLPGWQSLIGYLPQQIYLFDDTLRHNIALGKKASEIDDDLLTAAVQHAQLSDVAASLPNGLDTPLGENGVRLSGGQRQRIGIARALYHGSKVLVMDEGTSALDGETELEITSAIRKLSGEKTVLIIAHRLSTVRHCDKIVMMENGMIVDQGSFDELAARCSQFKRLVELADLQGGEEN